MTDTYRVRRGDGAESRNAVHFTFEGKSYQGLAGDTLASALIANGVHLVGRSFKYHRPRGFVSAGSEEPNALVGVGATQSRYTPNLLATQVEIYEGLVAESQNRWPSLETDAGFLNEYFSAFLPAGFYYKTFMWPRMAWKKLYEPVIRRMAGLGRAPAEPDADRYTQVFAHCDVLIVGAGPAGLAAALEASNSDATVILCDEQAEMGGSLLSDRSASIDGMQAADWARAALDELRKRPNVKLMSRTTAFGWYPHNFVGLNERVTDHLANPAANQPRERLWQVRAKEVVLAAGAIERPLVFTDNDRPGIMLADAARTYVNRYGVVPGKQVVVFTACDSAYRAALDLKAAGAKIQVIVDLRKSASGHWVDKARAEGIKVRSDSIVRGTSGRLRVKSAQISNAQGGDAETVACDLILMSAGFTPSVHLFSQSRGKLSYSEELRAYVPGESVERERSVGACKGLFALDSVIESGAKGGRDAAAKAGFPPRGERSYTVSARSVGADAFIGSVMADHQAEKRAWVDFQNDVTAKDVRLATREGFRSIEHVKRYTTTGMATDQGKLSNMNALGVVSKQIDVAVPKVGLTTFRPPYTPTTFGSFAGQSRGDLFDPVRKTSIHPWAEAQGAQFEDVGVWKRAWYFPQVGEDMHAAVARECKATRESVGIFDASTLGKIEIVGKDAAEFMNRMYTNAWTKLEPGRLRYGVMLREDGFIMDDGVVGRMATDRFHVTTTTGGAARVLSMMEDYLQTEWPDLEVWLTSTTEQWSVIALQGPNARRVLEPLVEGIDLSADAMPHMSVRQGRICGVPTRLFRVSFTGELGFEVNVPAGYGRAVWEAIFAAGKSYGITPYGTETMHVLRAEKGYIIVGQETDGTVTPDDAGLGWAVGKAKRDFVGKRSLSRPALVREDRKQLVGLLTTDPKAVLEEGAQIVLDPTHPIPVPMIGHVTSAYWSATLNRSIALALVRGGRSRMGEELSIPMPDGVIKAKVVDSILFDPKGERLNA
ncbi:sarcosine oxidase subunit alpha [Tardiphaga robiniae]|uniref:Sarcosine oxidase subunit alpha n=1 Tax=Tardiphaga robiniae TaxID=943830 RepID=A0A161QY54_9BRAD|nr:sarcosine oxidase subunit alpha [Tardiphaga robiniae]KZD20931.1 sarcosine oxidase subunit alpha [Tardiphaga robiniae]